MNTRSAAFLCASAALREDSSSVPLTREQVEAGASFGDLLRGLREERGWTVADLVERMEGLLVKGRVTSVDLRAQIEAQEKAAACVLSPWMATIVAGAMEHTRGGRRLTMKQGTLWMQMVRGAQR